MSNKKTDCGFNVSKVSQEEAAAAIAALFTLPTTPVNTKEYKLIYNGTTGKYVFTEAV
jgi:hypothetical protein